MAILYCDAKRFKQIIIAGADWVVRNRDQLNKINVFPVPDGDTGSNMSMTLNAAVREMETLKDMSLETTIKAVAWGSLMGARGNSGIIMAQILSGLAEGIEGRERIFAEDIVFAFSRASKKAYKAVLHPTEGTILTVIRETAESAEETVKTEKDLARLLAGMVRSARSSVERTPTLLPKLKEAGVVDAGGLGFFYFLEGMLRLILGQMKAPDATGDEGAFEGVGAEGAEEHHWNFRYCTEFILKGSRISEDAIRASLADMGDSVVVVGDSRLARVHIHTNEPQEALRYASTLGQVSSIKVEDMLVQHTSRVVETAGVKPTSVVAIVLGDGFKVFYSAGAELVVDGGPTQNPSTSDIVFAIESASAPNVIILPNHRNVYPAALQAGEKTSKKVTVLKTSSFQEGLSAMLAYMDDASTDENIDRMGRAFKDVRSGEVTMASRDAVLGGVTIRSGDFIGVHQGKIECSCGLAEEAVACLIEKMADDAHEIITLFYGESVEKNIAETVQSAAQTSYPEKAVELYFGGQPFADYIVSVE